MCPLTRLKQGIFLLKRELSGTSLNASRLIKDQERSFYYSIQGEAICIAGLNRFFFFKIYLISILSARQSGMARSLLSFSPTERPRRLDSMRSLFPAYEKVSNLKIDLQVVNNTFLLI